MTSGGTSFAVRDFTRHIEEVHVEHSNALHARLDGAVEPYVVGPLARYTLNFDRLSDAARAAAAEAGLGPVCRNPFRSIVVRAVELVEAYNEALRIIDGWADGAAPSVPVPPRAGEGFGASEAPRGMLFHRYVLDDDGIIRDAQIVPPTSQNQRSVEADLRDAGAEVVRPRRPRPAAPLRAGHPQLRPVHLVRHPLPRPHGGPRMTGTRPLPQPSTLVVGLGSVDRGDDAVGRARGAGGGGARRPAGRGGRARGPDRPDRAVARPRPGRRRRRHPLRLRTGHAAAAARPAPARPPLPEAAWARTGRGGTHAFGLAAAVELARVLGRLPGRVTVVGVEAGSFEPGAPLSPAVAAAVPRAVDAVLDAVSDAVPDAVPAPDGVAAGERGSARVPG